MTHFTFMGSSFVTKKKKKKLGGGRGGQVGGGGGARGGGGWGRVAGMPARQASENCENGSLQSLLLTYKVLTP